MSRIRLADIAFDAGTQIREAISDHVVNEYAERMTEGNEFPPVVLFHDGTRYYMADGFHRGLASTRNGFIDILADVRVGTKEDALWFALGANRANGHRMTDRDKRHAITLALNAWPDKSAGLISQQVGCSVKYVTTIRSEVCSSSDLPDRVTGKDGKSYPASHRVPAEKIAAVEQKLRDGVGVTQIADELRINTPTIHKIRAAAGIEIEAVDKSRAGVEQRRERMRAMAADGHSSIQIAQAVGLTLESCRNALRELAIDVPADKVIGGTQRHNSTRIVEHMVMDAENLTADVNLIDFSSLPFERIGDWADSLTASRKALDAFIKRLIKEQQKHGEAA